MQTAFEKLVSDLMLKDYDQLVAESMKLKPGLSGRIPYRYRVIALGFVMHLSLEQVNQRLADGGEARLYARSYTEATLIYAFRNGLGYDAWRQIYAESLALFADAGAPDSAFARPTLRLLKDYVISSSEDAAQRKTQLTRTWLQAEDGRRGLQTARRTEKLEQDLSSLNDNALLMAFLRENILAFCPSREKARYYFCKYLCAYLEAQISDAVSCLKAGRRFTGCLTSFKDLDRLSMSMTEQELRCVLENSRISCGMLFDEFNMFYFDYVSVDWLEKLMEELENDPLQLPPEKRTELARHLRSYYPKWRQLTDDGIIQAKLDADRAEEERLDRMTAAEFYGMSRSGESSIREYIKGTADIDRTALLFYLIFFGSRASGQSIRPITVERLNEILEKCGFAPLEAVSRDALDYFIINYFRCPDRMIYLEETISSYAAQEKNFPLFKLYRDAISNQNTAARVFGGAEA